MAEYDLNGMSKQELLTLQKDVAKALKSYEDRKKKDALAVVSAKAEELGYSLQELTEIQGSKAKRKAPPKYRDPHNPENTWSGLGRQPQWLKDALADGSAKSKEDFLIAA